MEALIFYVLAGITLASAFFVVFLRRPMHNVLFMIITMIGLAGLFILLQAEFVAMVQIVVYAGAVMVLFLFVIMLLNLDQIRLPDDPRALRSWIGVGLALAVLVLIVPVLAAFVPNTPVNNPVGAANVSNTALLAEALFGKYLLPFEIASVLLLAAIIGSVILAKKKG
ncbi:MAG TPA: NADH-quinone oxidoreductase subunit J [Desulfomonilaceae bacterium]|nr:NADH-quinone oxidoreductase subunit J [Desulfomonilaceae bacterium]